MQVVLELAEEAGQIRGTAIWGTRTEPMEFAGWLDLVYVLEAAQRDASNEVADSDG